MREREEREKGRGNAQFSRQIGRTHRGGGPTGPEDIKDITHPQPGPHTPNNQLAYQWGFGGERSEIKDRSRSRWMEILTHQ